MLKEEVANIGHAATDQTAFPIQAAAEVSEVTTEHGRLEQIRGRTETHRGGSQGGTGASGVIYRHARA